MDEKLKKHLDEIHNIFLQSGDDITLEATNALTDVIKLLIEQRNTASCSAMCSETTRERWVKEQDEALLKPLEGLWQG